MAHIWSCINVRFSRGGSNEPTQQIFTFGFLRAINFFDLEDMMMTGDEKNSI
jgi:hypothetical protein